MNLYNDCDVYASFCNTLQKIEFYIKDFFSKLKQISISL